ncbi:MFS transporter [Naumannella halotolerans]|uniref:MFS transporter n=1 Tax=Naumannella halotolerans TaxID=993414 RepID=UPI001AAF7661|nr:MFS transporter [Naumannella halotolerans]
MQQRGVLAVVLSAQFVIPLSIAGSAVALPQIGAELGFHPVGLPGVVNGFNLAFALCTVVWGVASDRIGHTRSFRIGVGLAALGSAVSAVAGNLLLLDLARVIAGIGAAAVLTGAAPIINALFSGAARSRAFALFGTVNGLGLAAGPFLSGVLLTIAGWRAIFVAHALVLLLALAASGRIPSSSRQPAASRARLFDFGALRSHRFLAMTIVPVAGAIGFVCLLIYLPSALHAVHEVQPGTAGSMLLIMTIPVLVAPAAVHRLRAAVPISTTTVVVLSLLCLLFGAAGMLLLRAELPLAVLVVPMILLGLGSGYHSVSSTPKPWLPYRRSEQVPQRVC